MNGFGYLNGVWAPLDRLHISPLDRGFLFGDGIYEVIRVRNRRPFRLEAHLERLEASARGILLNPGKSREEVRDLVFRLLEQAPASGEALVYIQVTRGVQFPRSHAFPPPDTPPTWFLAVWPFEGYPEEIYTRGVNIALFPEVRWRWVHLKTVQLLPNVLAKEEARRKGAFEGVFVTPDGLLVEGSSSTLFAVRDGAVLTTPSSTPVLPGITRKVVEEACRGLGIPLREAPLRKEDFPRYDEMFLASTTAHVVPVVAVEGESVGKGKPGPVTREILKRVLAIYFAETG